jgi:hypothetical protein
MFDLAANILSTAASELLQMDSVKKEIVYNLGLVYSKMGQEEKSIECMKQIYELDYGIGMWPTCGRFAWRGGLIGCLPN